ncbi:hypothetical protein ADK94_35300 [Streptomyces sp. XY593]|nr:hypothetical protein ADK49_33960 [Streptomyces sp. WM6349]KOU78118.1 hypothetical protein ADK94_35300 [Streptomyces sp. XY593]KOV39857.1 hypothetical protein ADK98_30855 [Streptomyces sp. H036]
MFADQVIALSNTPSLGLLNAVFGKAHTAALWSAVQPRVGAAGTWLGPDPGGRGSGPSAGECSNV